MTTHPCTSGLWWGRGGYASCLLPPVRAFFLFLREPRELHSPCYLSLIHAVFCPAHKWWGFSQRSLSAHTSEVGSSRPQPQAQPQPQHWLLPHPTPFILVATTRFLYPSSSPALQTGVSSNWVPLPTQRFKSAPPALGSTPIPPSPELGLSSHPSPFLLCLLTSGSIPAVKKVLYKVAPAFRELSGQ